MVSISGIGRIAKAAGRLIFMDGKFSEVAESSLKASFKSQGWKGIHRQIGDCFVKAENATKARPFWSEIGSSITHLPKDLAAAWKGASGGWAKTCAIGGQLMKRLPLLFVALEIPNIYSAFKDEGLIGGVTEIFKSGTRCAGSMAGFITGSALGQALIPIPIVGGLIGGLAGAIGADWLISKVVGKSHTEKKEELEQAMNGSEEEYQKALEQYQQLQQQDPYQNPYGNLNQMAMNNPFMNQRISMPRATMSPQQVMRMGQMLYGGGLGDPMSQDFMAMTSGMNRLNYMC